MLRLKESFIQILMRKHKGKNLSKDQSTDERIILIWKLRGKLERYGIHLPQYLRARTSGRLL
jgi:hypothetical protein